MTKEGPLVVVPTVLVATVGLNPLPVVLAILTKRPAHVVLVHSNGSQAIADRVKRLVESIATWPRESVWVTLVRCGAATEFTATKDALEQGLARARVVAPYLLDYTGGNKIMTVVAVWTHLRDHDGDGGQWRSYVDHSVGQVVTGSNEPGAGRADVDSTGLTLQSMAELHGFDIAGTPIDPVVAAALDTTALCELITESDRASQHNELNRVNRSLAVFMKRAGLPIEADDQSISPSADRFDFRARLRGLVREVIAVHLIARGAVGSGKSVEIVHSARLTGTHQQSDDDSTEFDVLVRDGHRVLNVEVKSSALRARETLGQRVVYSRLVFGGATTTVVAATEGATHTGGCRWSDVERAQRGLATFAPWARDSAAWEIAGTTGTSVEDGFRQWLSPERGPADATPDDPFDDDEAVVMPYIGTRLAVLAAIESAPTLVPVGTRVVGIGHRRAPGTPGHDPRTWFARHCADSAQLSVANFSEAATAAVVDRASAVIVTAGPKGITSGLTRAVFQVGGVIGHVGLDGGLRTFDGTREEVHPTTWTVPWEMLLTRDTDPATAAARAANRRTARPRDAPRPDFALWFAPQTSERSVGTLKLVAEYLDKVDGIRVWWRQGGGAARLDNPRPELVITGAHGACSVHVFDPDSPEWHKPGTVERIGKPSQKFRFRTLSASTEMADLLGDAHRPLVILPAHDVNARRGNTWMTIQQTRAEVRRDSQWDKLGRVERWLPLGLWHGGGDSFRLCIDENGLLAHLRGSD
ncbi:hypothetical protein ACGFIX_14400 [Nocardia salmonicida]|uniref:hypothetical protein n=1 Tax=Nocardia salmonicida TaxID=53431 RepID=UPI00372061ED